MKVSLLIVNEESIYVVFMVILFICPVSVFKFLHHVPIELMGLLMREIKQVLKQGVVSLCASKDFIIR